jgi:hypothetical protein
MPVGEARCRLKRPCTCLHRVTGAANDRVRELPALPDSTAPYRSGPTAHRSHGSPRPSNLRCTQSLWALYHRASSTCAALMLGARRARSQDAARSRSSWSTTHAGNTRLLCASTPPPVSPDRGVLPCRDQHLRPDLLEVAVAQHPRCAAVIQQLAKSLKPGLGDLRGVAGTSVGWLCCARPRPLALRVGLVGLCRVGDTRSGTDRHDPPVGDAA